LPDSRPLARKVRHLTHPRHVGLRSFSLTQHSLGKYRVETPSTWRSFACKTPIDDYHSTHAIAVKNSRFSYGEDCKKIGRPIQIRHSTKLLNCQHLKLTVYYTLNCCDEPQTTGIGIDPLIDFDARPSLMNLGPGNACVGSLVVDQRDFVTDIKRLPTETMKVMRGPI